MTTGTDAAASTVARAFLAAFDTHDPDAIAALVSDDFRSDHMSALGARCDGREEYARRLPTFLAAFPGITYDVERIIAQDDTVAVEYHMRAVSEGHPVDVRGVMVLEVSGGLVRRRTDYWDSLGYLRQIGHAPPIPSR
ncbi:MAG: nuclear transport factor 2 family protein [Ilumatobacteraceae bacterium]